MTISRRGAYYITGTATGIVLGISSRFFGLSPAESLLGGGLAVLLLALTIAAAYWPREEVPA